jgi:hypothetical protein
VRKTGTRLNGSYFSRLHLRIKRLTEKLPVSLQNQLKRPPWAMHPGNGDDASSATVRIDLSSQTHSAQRRYFIYFTRHLLIQIRSFFLSKRMIGKHLNRIFRSRQHMHIKRQWRKFSQLSLSSRSQLKHPSPAAMHPDNCNDASPVAVRTDLRECASMAPSTHAIVSQRCGALATASREKMFESI